MNIPRGLVKQAANFAAFCSLLLFSTDTGLGQGGPPPLPPIPWEALNFWPLEKPGWGDWYEGPARGFTNLNVAPSWDYTGTALSVDTNVCAYLEEDVFQDGWTNIVFDSGSISLWFQPNWTSVTDGGAGPTNWAALLSVGNWTSNAAQSAWTLAISPAGTNMVMEVQSAGSNQVVFDVPIDFDAGDWHALTVTYSLTNCCLYLEGQPATNTGPILYYPGYEDCTNYGFFIGSVSASGIFQCHGQLQWLATYDYPLSADAVAADYANVSSYITYFGGSLPSGGGFQNYTSGPPVPPGGGTNIGGGSPDNFTNAPFTPPATISPTNYAAYDEFYLAISNSPTAAYVAVCNTLSNITYEIWTNSTLSASNGWGIWQVLLATNNVTPAPALTLGTNCLFFKAALVWSTCTNYTPPLPDWWAELYFHSTACVNPTGNPAGDGIDNWDKYILGLNPNIVYASPLLISPPGGNYVSTPSISIFSLTGSSINYTTNGSTPSATNGTAISSGVPLTNLPAGNFTLKAWENGLISNVPVSATYTITPATPVFSIAEGVYGYGTTLHISSATSSAIVRYTTNGSDPATNSVQIQPTNVITLVTNETIKAAAWLGTNVSAVASAAFIVEGTPLNDNFSNAITLTGSAGEFRGTTVGSTAELFETTSPENYFYWSAFTGHSVWYEWTAPSNGNVFFDYSKCNRASTTIISFYYFPTNSGPNPTNLVPADSFDNSDYTSMDLEATQSVYYYICITAILPGAFDISWEYPGTTLTPIFRPDAGTYQTAQSVTVSDNDTNAVIYYTLNGSSPTTNSAIIVSGASLAITATATLKAAAWRPGLQESAVKSALYTINAGSTNPTLTASAPILSPTNTNFAFSLTVTLTCSNAGAFVYYTMDGSTPTSASARVSSGGTVTLTNSTLFNASAWVTNMNFSPITTGWYAKNGVDTTGDGILDSVALLIGANPFVSDANAVNPNPFAHGLNNMQVSQNQSVMLANNYSTLSDGIPDWWLVQNGYGVTTPASALGANGQTLLTSYLAGLSPNNPSSRPGQLPPIDFHIVHGPTNSLVLVLDTINPSVVTYFLYCTPIDTNSGLQSGPSEMEQFDADRAMNVSGAGPGPGRYFELTNALSPGSWLFTLQGVNSNSLWSTTSSNTFAKYYEQITAYANAPTIEQPGWQRYSGMAIPVVGYTNLNNQKWPLLIQMLRAESDTWVDTDPFDTGWWYGISGPVVFDDRVPSSVTTETSWGTLTFQVHSEYYSYGPYGYASYFTPICATPDSPLSCNQTYGDGYYGGYPFPQTELAPLQLNYAMGTNSYWTPYFAMPADSQGQSSTFNPAGLQYLSVTYRIGSNDPVTLLPGESNTVPDLDFDFEVALQTETPTLQTIGYAFDGRDYPLSDPVDYVTTYKSGPPGPYPGWSQVYMDGWVEAPGIQEFFCAVSVTNPVIVGQIGRPVNLQAWSQLIALRPNGTPLSNQICSVDQDFDQAYLCNPATGDVPRTTATNYNGKMKIDTNAAVKTGILSPCLNYPLGANNIPPSHCQFPTRGADFTPTQPGKVIVTTKPDPNGYYGEVTIYVIDMQVDANHDGLMDNRDLTCIDNPMQFWVNNDYDRGHTVDTTDWEQDDLNPGTDGFPLNGPADCNFIDPSSGLYAIPSLRDLEDYARLWIPGFSNMMANLPTNYTVTLQWRNNTGAAIRIFMAAETNGGTNYLFNTNTATLQTNYLFNPCYGYVLPNQPLNIGSEYLAWSSAFNTSDHFIFCGSAYGNDELVLQVQNPWGGVVGEASVFLNLMDIKQMYERCSVGENPSLPPNNIATNAGDDGSASFQYPYDPQTDSGTPYILFVHGYNMPTWEKDRYAETAYKRLYWQGYQGRFGEFRWPTHSTPVLFDSDEWTSWQSAIGLKNLLVALNIQYPEKLYLLAHSLGNIAGGEALRLAGANQIVNTYVASQAAVSARVYDNTIPTDVTNYYTPVTPDSEGRYYTNGAPPYFNGISGAGVFVDYYNPVDWALMGNSLILLQPGWLYDQSLKPDISYSWDGTHFWHYSTSLQFTNDTYQIFAMCVQSYSLALGAETNLPSHFNPLLSVNLNASPYTFGSLHKGHSGQFRSDNMTRWTYWHQLLISFNIQP